MNSKRITKIFSLLALCAAFGQDVAISKTQSVCAPRMFNEDGQKFLNQRLRSTWLPLVVDPSLSCKLTVKYEDTRIKSVQFLKKSGSAQFDLGCLEAVLAADDFVGYPFTCDFTVNLEAADVPTEHTKYIGKLKTSGADELRVFRIPPDVLIRWPTLFSEDEIFAVSNFQSLPNDSADNKQLGPKALQCVEKYYRAWTDFFYEHDFPSKQDIILQSSKTTFAQDDH